MRLPAGEGWTRLVDEPNDIYATNRLRIRGWLSRMHDRVRNGATRRRDGTVTIAEFSYLVAPLGFQRTAALFRTPSRVSINFVSVSSALYYAARMTGKLIPVVKRPYEIAVYGKFNEIR